MNAVVEVDTASMVPARSANPTAEVVAHAKTVQQVMQAVMKPNVHSSNPNRSRHGNECCRRKSG